MIVIYISISFSFYELKFRIIYQLLSKQYDTPCNSIQAKNWIEYKCEFNAGCFVFDWKRKHFLIKQSTFTIQIKFVITICSLLLLLYLNSIMTAEIFVKIVRVIRCLVGRQTQIRRRSI